MRQVFPSISKALFTLAVCLSLSAAAGAQSETARGEVPGPIRFTGISGQMLQFDVNLPAVPSRSMLRITDEGGELLHAEFLAAGNYNRRYKVPATLAGKLRFEVVGKDYRVKQVFDITRQLEERVVVTASL